MDSLSTLLLLALLALGQATPLTTVTQNPRTDQDGISEADGFIVDQELLTSLTTTQTPWNMTTTPESTTTEGGEEGSAMGESLNEGLSPSQPITTQPTSEPFSGTSALPDPSSTPMATSDAILLNEHGDLPFEDTTQTEPSEDKLVKTTSADLLSTMSEHGSGEPDTSSADPDESTKEPLTHITLEQPVQKIDRGRMINFQTPVEDTPIVVLSPQSQGTVTEKPKGHVTPDWIIILGFLVGIAALVLICVAIATRERWNGPDQFNRTGVTLTPANQQSELEMEEFLHRKHPRENGKADEYTVIPLDELPDSYSS